MRMPFSLSSVSRFVLAFLLVAGAVTLINAASNPTYPTVHHKAFYADPNMVNFVRPGLAFKIQSAEIGADANRQHTYAYRGSQQQQHRHHKPFIILHRL